MLWTIPLITTLASSAYDWWRSNKQENRAEELERNNIRPRLDVPQSQQEALASAKAQAQMTRLPGQDAIEGRFDNVTGNKVATVERMGPGGATSINAASRAYSDQLDKESELGVTTANMRLNNQGILRDELRRNAEWEQKAWDWNTGQPYMQKQAAIAALKEASILNQNTAFKNLIGGLGYTAFMGAVGDDGKIGGGDGWFDKGAKTTPQTPTTPGSSIATPNFDYLLTPQTSGGAPVTTQNPNKDKEEILNYTDRMLGNPFR
jgi:hypothetical protein